MAINFQEVAGWSETDNHDSSLTGEQMRALIMKIPQEIADPVTGKCPCDEIKNLFRCFSDKPMHKLKLVKGIHQDAQLHYTIALLDGGCFHVYVAQGATQTVETKKYGSNLETVRSNMKKYTETSFSYSLFDYKNVGISYLSCDENYRAKTGVQKLWPAMFRVRNNYAGRVRGNSFSLGNSAPIAAYAPTSAQVRKDAKPTLRSGLNQVHQVMVAAS